MPQAEAAIGISGEDVPYSQTRGIVKPSVRCGEATRNGAFQLCSRKHDHWP